MTLAGQEWKFLTWECTAAASRGQHMGFERLKCHTVGEDFVLRSAPLSQ